MSGGPARIHNQMGEFDGFMNLPSSRRLARTIRAYCSCSRLASLPSHITGDSTDFFEALLSTTEVALLPQSRWFRVGRSTLLLLALVLASFAASHLPYPVRGANSTTVPLYLHHLPGNVSISGFQTNQVLNTTTLWGGTSVSSNLRYNVFNLTLYPALTSSMRSVGSGSIILWVTVNGANPGSMNATIYDANAAGQVAIVSSSLSVTNSTSPLVPYKVTLGFFTNHTYSQSSTIKLSLTAVRVSSLQVYYDSIAYPSALLLPVSNIPRVSLIQTFDWNFNPQSSFSLNWTTGQRIVFLTVHVADPFGAYHVANSTITITGPGPTTLLSQAGNSLTTNAAAPEKLFALNWPYAPSLPAATYVVSATASDTAGDQDTNTVNFSLTAQTSPPAQPPAQQPPPGPQFPYLPIAIGAALGLLALLLGFLFLARRRRVKCAKCGARVDGKLDKCPVCGSPLMSKAAKSSRSNS